MILEVEFTREVTSHGYVTVDEDEFEEWANEHEFVDTNVGDGRMRAHPHYTLANAPHRDVMEFLHSGREPWEIQHQLSDSWEVESGPSELTGIKARDLHFPVANSVEQLSLP